MRCGPIPALAIPPGVIGALLYGLSIIYGQKVWPAKRLWNKVCLARYVHKSSRVKQDLPDDACSDLVLLSAAARRYGVSL